MSIRAVVSYSGGMDSLTLLASMPNFGITYNEVLAISCDYGSKHAPHELCSAVAGAQHYKVRHEIVDMTRVTRLLQSNLLRTGGEIPEGHYEAETMKATVVPGRNMLFISLLTGIAQSVGAEAIYIGVHAGDHHIYPDCRASFIGRMGLAVWEASEQTVTLSAPFISLTKDRIVKCGLDLKVPYHLSRTCYKDQSVACGKCGSCQERLEAFQLNGATDPLPYESREIMPKTS